MQEHDVDLFSAVREPLRHYALQYLSAMSLVRLRQVNRASQLLTDDHTGSTWKAVASPLLHPACLPDADHGSAIQTTLREQGILLQSLRAGVPLYISMQKNQNGLQ